MQLSLPVSAELTMYSVKPHVGLYAKNTWICWLSYDEAALLATFGVGYGLARKAVRKEFDNER